MKGVYVLVIYNNKDREVDIGRLGRIRFEEGFYAYIGSSKGDLFKRISRQLNKKRSKYWHIDYLLDFCKVKLIYYSFTDRNVECEIARNLRLKPVKNFGSSNCRCKSHLFYSKDISEIKKSVEESLKKLGLNYKMLFC